jgi:hypothetical protein
MRIVIINIPATLSFSRNQASTGSVAKVIGKPAKIMNL